MYIYASVNFMVEKKRTPYFNGILSSFHALLNNMFVWFFSNRIMMRLLLFICRFVCKYVVFVKARWFPPTSAVAEERCCDGNWSPYGFLWKKTSFLKLNSILNCAVRVNAVALLEVVCSSFLPCPRCGNINFGWSTQPIKQCVVAFDSEQPISYLRHRVSWRCLVRSQVYGVSY